jgi:hypothetical protein
VTACAAVAIRLATLFDEPVFDPNGGAVRDATACVGSFRAGTQVERESND